MNDSTLVQFIVIAIGAGTPLVFAATGEILAERSGVMNLGLEGLMLLGAIFAYWATVVTENVWLGLLAGAAAGVVAAAVFAFIAISLRANQIVAGIALVIVGTGISSYLGEAGPTLASRDSGGVFEPILPGGLADLPLIGPLILGHSAPVYLSWLFVAGTSWYLFRTRAGLAVRAVGENPATADSSGLDVTRVRYAHVLAGGAAAGVGGACLTLSLFGAWADKLSNGAGWIAFAIVIFSTWRPWRALAAAYLFGALTSLGFNLQLLHIPVPLDLLAALPFLMTLIALIVMSGFGGTRRLGAPAALAEPYWREQR